MSNLNNPDILNVAKLTTEELYDTTLTAMQQGIPNFNNLKSSVQGALTQLSIPMQQQFQDGLYSLFPALTSQQAPEDVVINLGEAVGLPIQNATTTSVELTFQGSTSQAGTIIPSGTIVQNQSGSTLVSTNNSIVLNAQGFASTTATAQSNLTIPINSLVVCNALPIGIAVNNPSASEDGLPAETTQQYYARVQNAMKINRIGALEWAESLISSVNGVRGVAFENSTVVGQIGIGELTITSGSAIAPAGTTVKLNSTVDGSLLQTSTLSTTSTDVAFTTTSLSTLAIGNTISGSFTVYTATGSETINTTGLIQSISTYQQNAYNIVIDGGDQYEVAFAILNAGFLNTKATASQFNDPATYTIKLNITGSQTNIALPTGTQVSTATSFQTILTTSFVGYLTTSAEFTVGASQSQTVQAVSYNNPVATGQTLHVIGNQVATPTAQKISAFTTTSAIKTSPIINVDLSDITYPQSATSLPTNAFYNIQYLNAYQPNLKIDINATISQNVNLPNFQTICQQTIANYVNLLGINPVLNLELMNSLIKQAMVSNAIPLNILSALSFTIIVDYITIATAQTDGLISSSPSTYGFDALFNIELNQIQVIVS